ELARDERRQEDVMTKKSVRFYFAYNSPYSFLASSRIERELAPLGAEAEYKPVYSPRTGGAPDLNSPRFRYLFEDVLRFAEAYGLALNPGPFADSKQACCGFFFAREKGRGAAYHDGVYRARWLEAGDIGHEEVAEPTLLVALLEPAALRPQEARLADHLRHVLLLEPAEVALAAVGRDPGLHHVEDGRVHGPLVACPLKRTNVCLYGSGGRAA